MSDYNPVEAQIKAKVSTLRSIIEYCDELQKLRPHHTPTDELMEVRKYAQMQINGLKELVDKLNSQF